MFLYYFKRARSSLHRTPFLTAIQVLGLAAGVAVFVTAHVSVQSQRRTLIGRDTPLYHVEVERGRAGPPIANNDFLAVLDAARYVLTWSEASELEAELSAFPVGRTFMTELALSPEHGAVRTRVTSHQLFRLFGLRFVAGGPWSHDDELRSESVCVISDASAEAWFGTTQAIGKTLRVGERDLRVVGVVDAAPDALRLFDVSDFRGPEDLYLPIGVWPELQATPWLAYPVGGTSTAAGGMVDGTVFVNLWVDLGKPGARAAAQSRLEAWGQAHGVEVRLRRLDDWFAIVSRMPPGFRQFEVLASLALFACALNLVRLYLSKFQARARDVSILRAMGARRREIFFQHLVETEMVAISGTVLGILGGKLGLRLMNHLIVDRHVDYMLDGRTLLTALAVGLAAGLLAGVYPAWQMSRLPPASFLRRE